MRILLIGLQYHGYTLAIAEELRLLGHEVRLHDLQPRTLPMKVMRVAAPRLWQSRLDAHHRRILRAERDAPTDLVLFIQAHQMSHANFEAFRSAFPDARFALYNWDSIANHDFLDRVRYFDTVQTFDPGDAAAHGFTYLPLFASRPFQDVPDRVTERRSVYFVGNIVNPNRFRAIQAFQRYCQAENIAFRPFMAVTPLVRRALKSEGLDPAGLSSGSIDPAAFRDMLETSNGVFDFANHAQTGYTMRVFENLCAGKKLITNNPRIVREAFYSPDRIHLFDGMDFDGVAEFLDTPLADPDQKFEEYRIQAFARHLAEGTGHAIARTGEQ